MELNGLVVLAVVWFLVSLLGKLGQKQQPRGEPRRVPRTGPPPKAPPLKHAPGVPDATQREGTRLELVLREFQRALEQADSSGQRAEQEPWTEEIDEQQSLEVEPEVRSLEQDVRREVRKRVDQDDEAEQIEVRRIQAAAARDATRTRADRADLDQGIRQEPADHTATRGYTAKQLRAAVVWREVLGPPVSMREQEGQK
jgi:hypothetical protein